MTRGRAPNGFAAVGAFTLLANLPFLAKPFHVDEPIFLAAVPQILRSPAHPLSFTYNWLGTTQTGPDLLNHSIITSYILAAASALTHGSEFGMRLACLPFDVVAACALYALAARFLKRPLGPVLTIIAGPAWFLSMPLLIAEKWMMCCILLSACALLRGLDEKNRSWYWLSAVSISLAITLKSTAACLLIPLAVVQWRRRVPPARIAAYLLACVALPALDAYWLEPWRLLDTLAFSRRLDPSAFAKYHRLRALLAFPAACGPIIAAGLLLPSPASRDRRRWTLLGALLAAALAFSPFLDTPGRAPVLFDRLLGLFFAFATLAALAKVWEPRSRRLPGGPLWLSWLLAGLAASWFNFFVSARSILIFLPVLILALAERLEEDFDARALDRFYGAGFCAILILSFLLARVDADFAGAQRSVASVVQGRKTWFTGHWGFQYYMEKAGAAGLDAGSGGWAAVKTGDLVVVPLNNTLQLLPPPALRYKISEVRMNEPIPLRLIDIGRRQAGFYASPFGFLPYTVSLEPLDVFTMVETL